MKTRALLLALASFPLLCIAADEPAFLPKKVGEMEFIDMKDFEGDEKTRGLGRSYRYEGDRLLKADVFVYDKRMKNLKDGIASPEAEAEIAAAAHVLDKMQELGRYKDVKELENGRKTHAGVPFLWCRHTYEHVVEDESKNPGLRVSDTYIRIKDGKFIKVRVSTLQVDLEKDQKKIDALMAEIARKG
ncbi:hypothetical protein OVA24_18245 [Luteolibacter sp. SL250]|uniref:hypothetical protein n=1 Tax=Luteolibacter sp. SL250 TaxID=2995170 RepID=UPI00226F98B7|nr:hypothetical protein [Luteolibacter sp. SL250]WAC19171.1 hypothetical protein OVA24_18245 [Luteolibacter sp. SL250]